MEKAIGQSQCKYNGFGKLLKILITLFIINLAWIFFRMPTISDAFGVIGHILEFDNQSGLFWPDYNNLFISFGVMLLIIKDFRDEFFPRKIQLMENRYLVVRWATYLALVIFIMLNGVLGSDQFIYANF